MRIGLVRHFRIPHNRFQIMDGPGFDAWAHWYDTTEVSPRPLPPLGEEWHHCLSSDLHRAQFTARTLYKGGIETTPLLREVPFSTFMPRRLRLPLFMWQATSRMGWYVNHAAQRENRRQTRERISAFVGRLQRDFAGRNVLIVTHGFFMQYLEKELRLAGFKGAVPMRPIGGTIYLFED
jgi:broad specificity phosphatase PhoE